MATVYIGIGGNTGNREENLQQAIEGLRACGKHLRISPIYETDPVGYLDQPAFLNGVVGMVTDQSPREMMECLQCIECKMGRERSFRNAPRNVDLDILFYDQQVIDEPGLTIPHPRLHERGFVLIPLADLAPSLVHPVLGRTIRQLRDGLEPE